MGEIEPTLEARPVTGVAVATAPPPGPVRLDPAERAARGKAARAAAPRRSHGDWAPAADRPDPVALLAAQGRPRVPELLPIRHARMAASPFAFFRGAAAIMAADLAPTPQSALRVQLCGDAHLSNFGGFASPDRTLVFDVNDFDETLPGPWEWDVKRLVTSVEIAGRGLGHGPRERRRAAAATARGYREQMRAFARMGGLEVWYARVDAPGLIERFGDRASRAERGAFDRGVAKAMRKDSARAFAKLAHRVDGRPRIVSDPPLIVPVEELAGDVEARRIEAGIRALLDRYRATLRPDHRRLLDRYEYVHLARKVVGVGSVGTRAWIALLVGRDDGDPLFLQTKEAERSVLAPYAGASAYRNDGRRVVEGQRLMQAASDILLGWLRAPDEDGRLRDYYVRQLWDWKASIAVETLGPAELARYGGLCAWTLARAHARSGDAVAIGAYLGGGEVMDGALADFAAAYADQNERDHAAFRAAIARGDVPADE
jgi:uncharacterized protein (DUF2252 family)